MNVTIVAVDRSEFAVLNDQGTWLVDPMRADYPARWNMITCATTYETEAKAREACSRHSLLATGVSTLEDVRTR